MDPNSQFGYPAAADASTSWFEEPDDGYELGGKQVKGFNLGHNGPDLCGEQDGYLKSQERYVSNDNLEGGVDTNGGGSNVPGPDVEEGESTMSNMEALSDLLNKSLADESWDTMVATMKKAIGEKFEDLEKTAAKEREKVSGARNDLRKCSRRLNEKTQRLMAAVEESNPREIRSFLRKYVDDVAGVTSEVDRIADRLRSRELSPAKLVQQGASLASSAAERVVMEQKSNYIYLKYIIDYFFR